MGKLWVCPACHGMGGEKEVICDDGSGPFYQCGYCKGEGIIPKSKFYQVLGYQSGYRRWIKKQVEKTHALDT
jgi:DnaJ-class molecular chaperone